jgi:hypothetical protein
MLGNGEEITGGVTATLPDGVTIGVWSLGPAGFGGDASNGSSASSTAPDYSAMAAALEQVVDQITANMANGTFVTAAAQQGLLRRRRAPAAPRLEGGERGRLTAPRPPVASNARLFKRDTRKVEWHKSLLI